MLEALTTEFEAVEDPRDPCRVEHRPVDILVIAVCAVASRRLGGRRTGRQRSR